MRLLPTLLLLTTTIPASAVVVSGTILSPLGRPIPGARIQLISLTQTTRSIADTVSGIDGTYEIRSDAQGRFLLLTTTFAFAPQIGAPFYAGRTDLLTQDITLTQTSLTPSLTGTGIPQTQTPHPTTQIGADELMTRALLPNQLALIPGTFLNTQGQGGSRADLYLQGAPPDANAVLLDGIHLQQLGGRFNFAPFSTTGFAYLSTQPTLEIATGPNPLAFPAAEAATISLTTPEASTARPTLDYTGDAGNLHTWRNEAVVSLTHRRVDLLAAASRLDTSNALPDDRFHTETAAINLGYYISANTSLRLTSRAEDSAAPLPIPYDLGLQPLTRDANQTLLTTLTFDTRTQSAWHNQLRAAAVRTREQTFEFANPVARTITLHAANGYTTTGQPFLPTLPTQEDQATNRNVLTYTTDYPIKPWLQPLFTATIDHERALDAIPTERQTLTRTNLTFASAITGEIHHRLFYQASGSLNHATLFGFTGSPSLGLTYVPVQPGTRRFRGTTLRVIVAAGSREPSLAEQAQQILNSPRSRSVSFSADQTILHTLSITTTYFHNQFSHQPELLALTPNTIAQDQTLSGTGAYRTQGLTLTTSYRPRPRLSLTGSYTYLAALTEQSATKPAFNPNLPHIPIGATTALVGARPFHRPPHTGFFAIAYTGPRLTANLQASLASRADDSTFTLTTPTFLLPNRNLDFGYTRLDAALTYSITHRVTAFTQLTNLLNDQHIGPIGYPGLPLTIRSGLRIRLGRE